MISLLSWISRLLNDSNDAWKAIPIAFFNRHGGLAFLLQCSYNTKNLDRNISSFHFKLLDYFRELHTHFQDDYSSDLILWNNKDITIKGKSLYWKNWAESRIYCIHDTPNEHRNTS